MKIFPALLVSIMFLATACDSRVHVDGPYYLMTPEMVDDTAIFYCNDIGCALDGLPGPTVFAAGYDDTHLVLARHPRDTEFPRETDWSTTEYFYIRRATDIPESGASWERANGAIFGPLTREEFASAKSRLDLPEFSIFKRRLNRSDDF